MSVEIRSIRLSEYAAAAALWTAIHPHDPFSEADLLRQDQSSRDLGLIAVRLVALEGSEVLGMMAFEHNLGSHHPHKFVLEGAVWPQHQGQGVGAALWTALDAELRAVKALSARVMVSETDPVACGFLVRRGFVATTRSFHSTLNLAGFDFAPYADLETRLSGEGVRVISLAELHSAGTPNLPARLHALFCEVRLDVPRDEPASPVSLAEFEKVILGDPALLPEGYLIAVGGSGEWLGQSTVFRSEASPDLLTGLTGVSRGARGRGVATLLKLQVVRVGLQLGAPLIRTENASSNAPMLAVNDKLGFVREAGHLSFLKVWSDGERVVGPPPSTISL